ncbi:MAG: hypothetical protein ACK48K_19790 [Planctomycetota bacterium]
MVVGATVGATEGATKIGPAVPVRRKLAVAVIDSSDKSGNASTAPATSSNRGSV